MEFHLTTDILVRNPKREVCMANLKSKKSKTTHVQPNLQRKMDHVKEKGHQKLTILVVPHGRDQTIHIQISIFTVIFLAMLTLGLIGTAIFGIVKSNKIKTQLSELSSIYGIFFEYYLSASEEMREIQEDFSSIQENLLETYTLLDGSDDELAKIPSESVLFEKAEKELSLEETTDLQLTFSRKYFNEIYEIRALRFRMEENERLLDSNEESVEKQEQIFQAMPLRNPIDYFNLTSTFGVRKSPTTGDYENHEGIDLANAPGTLIRSTANGIVDKVVFSKVGYGFHVIIQHQFGYYTLYGHCSRILVKQGQIVQKGEVIAEVGSTGNVTGPHLHYEIWLDENRKTDPEEFMNSGIF